MINQSRRTLLKGIGYGLVSAVTVGATSTVLAAAEPAEVIKQGVSSVLPSADITIYRQQSVGKEIISLMNLTGEVVTLDSIKPVGLEHFNGSLVVTLNNVPGGGLALQPGERMAFEIEATSHAVEDELGIPNVLAGYVNIVSEHPAFNGRIPVTVFDSQVA